MFELVGKWKLSANEEFIHFTPFMGPTDPGAAVDPTFKKLAMMTASWDPYGPFIVLDSNYGHAVQKVRSDDGD